MNSKIGKSADRRWNLASGASALAAAAAALSAAPAMAQDDVEEEEVVIVTGTRIPNLTAPTAVTSITSENLELSGATNAADVLRAVPSFGVSTLSSANSNFLTAGGGTNTLELRNLGESRTLILVNGRRYISGLAGSGAVDLNTIPVDLIDRVEVITGGASAIYGSDALAGVVNFILKDDYEGLGARYQYGQSAHGDDVDQRIVLTAGGNFADGRGNSVLMVTYSQNDGVLSRDRDETAVDDIALCRLTGDINDCQIEENNFFSSFSEYGRFVIPSTGDAFTVSSGTGPTGTVVTYSNADYGFNRQHFRRYTTPIERFLISGYTTYDLAPSVDAFLETTYAHAQTQTEIEPYPHAHDDLSIGGISVNNPFVPAAIRDAAVAAGDTEIQYARRMTEIGNRGSVARRNTFRIVGGLSGDINEALSWDAYYGFARFEDNQESGGQINVSNMREALNAIDGDGDPTTFDPVCANPAAVAEGCVPINLFGLGSISEEAAAYVRAPAQRQQLAQQEFIGASIGGEAFQAPAGAAQFSLGAEWRRERAEDVPDALTQTGQNAGNKAEPTFGGYTVGEIFGELEVPLLRDSPLARELSVGAAFRGSDYNTIGTTEAYTGRLSWSPTDSLRFRAQYARAVRAPDINELFNPGGENFAPVSDPCNGVTASSTGQIAQNCLSIPAIAARVQAAGSFTLTQPEIQGTGGFTGKGNANLEPETSDSVNFGVVFNHDFQSAGVLLLSVDYFQIEIENTIGTVGRQAAVDLCYDVPASSFPNQFCGLIVRDSAGPAFQQGEITEVNSGFINEGVLKTDGIDVSAQWSSSFASYGDVSLRLNYTHLLGHEATQFGQTVENVGTVGYAEDEWQAAVLYRNGPVRAQWETTYIGDSIPSNTNPLFTFSVGEYVINDMQVAYDATERSSIYFGIDNIFDEGAPVILSGIPGNTTGTDTNASVYDPIGRVFYGGIRLNF